MDTESFSLVFEKATTLFPTLISRNSSSIWGWLDAGADASKDIIPTLERIHKTKPDIGSFTYFTNAVMKAKLEREAAMCVPAETKQPSDIRKAELLAKTRSLGIHLNPHDRQWLEAFEAL